MKIDGTIPNCSMYWDTISHVCATVCRDHVSTRKSKSKHKNSTNSNSFSYVGVSGAQEGFGEHRITGHSRTVLIFKLEEDETRDSPVDTKRCVPDGCGAA